MDSQPDDGQRQIRKQAGTRTHATIDVVEGLRDVLRQVQPVAIDGMSKQAAIASLEKEIRAMQQRGFTLDQVAQTLTENGLNIAATTLKNYLRRAAKRSQQESLSHRAGTARKSVAARTRTPAVATPEARPAGGFIPAADSDEL